MLFRELRQASKSVSMGLAGKVPSKSVNRCPVGAAQFFTVPGWTFQPISYENMQSFWTWTNGSSGWFSRENLNRKPMGFYHEKYGGFLSTMVFFGGFRFQFSLQQIQFSWMKPSAEPPYDPAEIC